jgi:hypothetical protein
VTILAVVTEAGPPPSTTVRYEVRNHADAPMWLVDDQWLAWRRAGRRIELVLNLVTMRPGGAPRLAATAGPAVEHGGAGGSPARCVRGVRADWLRPTPEPDAPRLGEPVEEPVLRWQREALSPPATLLVPPYDLADGDHTI